MWQMERSSNVATGKSFRAADNMQQHKIHISFFHRAVYIIAISFKVQALKKMSGGNFWGGSGKISNVTHKTSS
jgi:hypothetical protein